MNAVKTTILHSPNSRVAVASDFHFQHKREFIWAPRGLASCEAHTKKFLADLGTLTANDILLFLGDFSLNSSEDETVNLLRQIPARIFYIWGNHESWTRRIYAGALSAEGYRPGIEVYPLQWENVTFLGPQSLLKVNDTSIFLSHFAHRWWPNREEGAWHLCGHTHGNDPASLPDWRDSKCLDVGADVALKTVGRCFFWFDELVPILAAKETGAGRHGVGVGNAIHSNSEKPFRGSP
jgi:calcineurin-like phosphoesterase family protein